MRSESRMRIIMFLLCLQRGAGQAIPRAWMTNGRTGGSRTPRSRGASIGISISRLSLSRFEAHFNLGSHFDGVAALDRGLITKLRPLHSLTELRGAFQIGDLPFRVDDHFATNRSPLGLPKGCGLNGRTRNQKSALFIRRNSDFGDVLLLHRGVFLRLRGSGAAVRSCNGPYPRNQEYGPGGMPFHRGAQNGGLRVDGIEGQAGPGHGDDTLAACLERVGVLALIGIPNVVNRPLRR